jgi:hypothetical protein
MPWRVAHADRALDWLKGMFPYRRDIYTDHNNDYRGRLTIWVGLRDNRDKQDHMARLKEMTDSLSIAGYSVALDRNGSYFLLLDDIQRDVLRGKSAKGPTIAPKTQDEKRRENNRVIVPSSTPRNEVMRGLIERGPGGQGKHKNKKDYERGYARNPKHRNQEREAQAHSLDRLEAHWAAYSGNPDGKPIYDVKVDHGEVHALSGGHDIMKRLQDQYRIEQGGEARDNQEKRLASWDWRNDGIKPTDSKLVGKRWTGPVVQQWGKHHTGAPFAIIPRDTKGMRGQQDPYQKVVIQNGVITHDFGSVPRLVKQAEAPEWTMNRAFSGMVTDAFIARIKRDPELRDVFSVRGKNATLFMADYFDDPDYDGGSEYDVEFFQMPNTGQWRFNVGMTKGVEIIKKLSVLLKVKPVRVARWNANSSDELGRVERLAARFMVSQGGNV